MSDLLLTQAEVEALTGYKLPAYQVKWLRTNGIAHYVRRDGRPSVLRSTVETRGDTRTTQRPPSKPDPAALADFLGGARR